VHGLDHLLTLGLGELTVLAPNPDELELAIRLQSRKPEDRAWRHSLGAKARRLDAGESASIAIAVRRSLDFASDDEDALTLWAALTSSSGHRTMDLLQQLVSSGTVKEADA
jgi:predicted nucleic acid-binding protein